MAFSIESRVPFLDHRLVEFVFSLNDNDKINEGITKIILRESLKEILPAAIVNRTDKKGFVTPGEVRWLRGPLKPLTDNMNSETFPPFLNRKKIKDIMQEYRNGNSSKALFVWRIVCLDYWLKNFC
jgi:asparagine synthase (glutamine-hydrolysing)